MNILMAQRNFTIGDIKGNTDLIIDTIRLDCNTNDLIVFSELSLTGYPPLDLLNDDSIINDQYTHIERIMEVSREYPDKGIVFGYAHKNDDGSLYNRLVLLENGEILFTCDKVQLPTYNIFDEARYFKSGNGSNLFKYKNNTIAFFICEDIWPQANSENLSPHVVNTLKCYKPDLIISINASPSNIGKMQDRITICKELVKQYECPVIYVNQVGAHDEIIFDGASFHMNKNGKIVSQCNSFKTDLVSTPSDYNRDVLLTAVREEYSKNWLLYKHAVYGISEYVRKCGFKGVVVGSSGGIDSALVLALATDALGAENVKAITMPTKFSSSGSVNDSVELCANLGVELIELPIGDLFNNTSGLFNDVFKSNNFDVTEENMQARIRGLMLMAYSNKFGNLVLSTGNKSEMSVGYATLYGDMNGGINPLGDMYKTEVFELSEYYNYIHNSEIIPSSIINKAPSAELAPDQKDTNSLLPYDILDTILKLYIEGDIISAQLRSELKKQLNKLVSENIITVDDISKMVNLVVNSEYKRKQAPPIIRCQYRSFGFGRNIPVAKKYNFDINFFLKEDC